jgi:beta-galactosidase
MLHGADYNPDQWLHMPEVLDEDMRLMNKAHCTIMAVGIFAWTALEPEEGRYCFDWLDRTMDRLAENGMYAALATPSGAKPAWMARKYPEVLRVSELGLRAEYGRRHNHCFTSPVYRRACEQINTRLAERYRHHPALALWHVSNEYAGSCHCELCREAFRRWLKRTYEDDLTRLNRAWNTAFWSHTFTDWAQIQPPGRLGERGIHGHTLDWKRFVTDQTIDFFRHEAAPLRRITPDIPVTTNFMGISQVLDYFRFAREVDVACWDCYPLYQAIDGDVSEEAAGISFIHDIYRSMKGGKPWLLMESSPSSTNWMPVGRLRRPGQLRLISLQAVAHGSDSVQYFQWRKSRGSCEKFHGAVVDHCGHEHTRVFGEVARVGEALAGLDAIVGTSVRPAVGLIYDWQVNWAIDDAAGPRKEHKDYCTTCTNHYRAFWRRGIPVDVFDSLHDFSGYTLLIAPMLYLIRPGVAERIAAFVRGGGTLVTTYWSGIADEHDLVHLGGFPGPLREVCGVWAEEIDALLDGETRHIMPVENNPLRLDRSYVAHQLCELIHAENAEVLATYGDEFYAGRPALTVNAYGSGRAYYIASRNREPFAGDFYARLIEELAIRPVLDTRLPDGVTAQMRTDGESRFVFLLNFTREPKKVSLGQSAFEEMLEGKRVEKEVELEGYGVRVLRQA